MDVSFLVVQSASGITFSACTEAALLAGCTLLNGDPRIQDEFEQIHAELGRRTAAAQAAARLREQERNDDVAANTSAFAAAAAAVLQFL